MATQYDSYLLNSTNSIAVGTAPVTGSDLALTSNSETGETLSGIVTNSVTLAVISYAKVTVDGSTSAPVTVYTDIKGYYSVTVDPAQTYDISVSKTGFGTYNATGLTFTAGTSATRNVSLTALDGTGNMIYGIVVDTQGTPARIANALVTVANTSNEVVQFTQTNADGEYAVYDLADATYTVIVSKSAYGAAVASVTVAEATTPIVENNASLVASSATNTGSISGTITDTATTDPIASAWVGLYTDDSGDETLSQAVLSGSAGDYIFTNLAAGNYVIKSKQIADMT